MHLKVLKIDDFGVNGVAVARHGPILNHSEATGSRKLPRYLPDLRDTIFDQKYRKMIKNIETSIFPYISVYSDIYLFGVSRWCHLEHVP